MIAEAHRFRALNGELVDPQPPKREKYIPIPRADLPKTSFEDIPEFQDAWEIIRLVGQNPTVVGLAFYQRPTWGTEYEVLLGREIDPNSDVDRLELNVLNDHMFALAGSIDGFAPRICFLPIQESFDPNKYIEDNRRSQRALMALLHFI